MTSDAVEDRLIESAWDKEMENGRVGFGPEHKRLFRAGWLASRATTPEPGTPAARFLGVLAELEKRFPDPEPFSAMAPEGRYFAMLDAALTTQAPAPKACKYGDALCPCQDGDTCHYEGEKPFTQAPAEPALDTVSLLALKQWLIENGWWNKLPMSWFNALDDAIEGRAAPTPVEPARLDPNEIDHPTTRYFLKQVLHRLGIEPGERIDQSLAKLYAAIPAAVEPGNPANQAEPVGRCCYGGLKPKRNCGSCGAWVALPAAPVEARGFTIPVELPDGRIAKMRKCDLIGTDRVAFIDSANLPASGEAVVPSDEQSDDQSIVDDLQNEFSLTYSILSKATLGSMLVDALRLAVSITSARSAPPAVHQTIDGAPQEIWLQLHGDGEPDGKPVDYTSDVSWCWHKVHEHDVRYVLAAPAVPLEQKPEESV